MSTDRQINYNEEGASAPQNPSLMSDSYVTSFIGNIQDDYLFPSSGASDFDNETEETLARQRLLSEYQDTQPMYGSVQHHQVFPTSSNTQKMSKCCSRNTYSFLLVNMIVLLITASGRFHSPLLSQYLYQKFADNILGNASGKTSSYPCFNDSTSSSTTASVRDVQEKTSAMLLYLNLSSFSLGVFGCLVLGILSNILSRRQLLLIPMVGYLIKCVMITIVICWNLDLNWLFLGFAAEGILGNMCGVLLGIFLYITDITSRDKTRTIGISFIEGLKGFMAAGLNIATGKLIQNTGFIVPALFSAGCVLLSLFVVSLLPDLKPSLQNDLYKTHDQPVYRWWRCLLSPLIEIKALRVRRLVLIGSIAFLLSLSASVGTSKVETLYLMNKPFCFDSVTLGWYMCGRELAYNGLLTVGVPLFYKCFPGMILGVVGSLSALSGIIMYSIATSPVEVYHVIVMSMGEAVPLNLIRGETSRLLASEVQGPLLALFATLETVGNVIGTPALAVYKASLSTHRWLVWVVCGTVTAASAVLLIIYHVILKRHQLDCLAKEVLLRFSGKINSKPSRVAAGAPATESPQDDDGEDRSNVPCYSDQ